MSRRAYSTHIPDFRYVTFLAEKGSSMVHKMNPWTKLALLFFSVVYVTVVLDSYLVVGLLVFAIFLYVAARLPVKVLIGWWSMPILFVASLSILYLFTEPGRTLVEVGFAGLRIGITDAGLTLMMTLLAKALAVVTVSLTVFMTTKYNHVVHMVYRIMPSTMASVFLLTYRFMFETADEFSDILDAMHSRSGGVAKELGRRSRAFAGIFGIGFVHAFERAETISKAMEARGFTGSLPVVDSLPRPSFKGYALIVIAFAVLVVVAYSRYFDRSLLGW